MLNTGSSNFKSPPVCPRIFRRRCCRLKSRRTCVVFMLLLLPGFACLFRCCRNQIKPQPLLSSKVPGLTRTNVLVSIKDPGIGLRSLVPTSLQEWSQETSSILHHPFPWDTGHASHLDATSLTVILPVFFDKLGDLDDILQPLLSEETFINEIVLLCPPNISSYLKSVVDHRHGNTLQDISVLPWMDSVDDSKALISAASQVTTELLLFLGSEGLSGMGTDLLDVLLNPIPTDIPIGPCGITTFGNTFSCLTSSAPQRAAFVVPPLLLPTAMLRHFDVHSLRGADIWASLGDTVARNQSDGIGGYIMGTNDSSNDLCAIACQKAGFNTTSANIKNHGSKGLYLIDNTRIFDVLLPLTMTDSVFAIILPTRKNLEDFSLAICRMIDNGYDIHVLLISGSQMDSVDEHIGSQVYSWHEGKLKTLRCLIPFNYLGFTSTASEINDAVSLWLAAEMSGHSIIISSSSVALPSILEFERERRRYHESVVIQIPEEDLRFSDWIGTLTTAEWKNWNVPNLQISVVTNDRPWSLSRLLSSLQAARYFGDTVDLRINIEQTADQKTLQLVYDLEWNHGSVFVHHRVVHGGLLPAVVESWFPKTNDSFGLILEDDVEVSPLFYAWAKLSLLRFRYGARSNRSPSMFGVSLYQQKNVELRPEGRRAFNAQTLFSAHGYENANTPYLSQVPCSWGAVYFPEHWREFHSYLSLRFSEEILAIGETVAPGLRSNKWTKSWKRYFIEMVYLRGYLMLYPNYDHFVSLSTNHLEVGSHVKDLPKDIYFQKKSLFKLPLMPLPNDTDAQPPLGRLLDLPEENMPSWSRLPVLDLVGSLTSSGELMERGWARQQELAGCKTVARTPSRQWAFEARELFLCDTVE